MPVLIGDKIQNPVDNNVWQLVLQLRQIVELICAPKICSNVKIQKSVAPFSFQPNNTFVAHEVRVKGTLYKKNICVVLEKNDAGLLFGRIKLILIVSGTVVYFVTEACQSVCLIDQEVYCLTENKSYVCIDQEMLLDIS